MNFSFTKSLSPCIVPVLLSYVNWKHTSGNLGHDTETQQRQEVQLLCSDLMLCTCSRAPCSSSLTQSRSLQVCQNHICFCLWIPLHIVVLSLTETPRLFFPFLFCQFPAQHLLDTIEWLLDVLSLSHLLFQREYAVAVVWTQDLLVG